MQPIKDYFLIGDLHTAALVSKRGSIDWMCVPHFDSPSIFAALLDTKAGKCSVEVPHEAASAYVDETAIVKTYFKNSDSEFEVFDFMVPQARDVCQSHYLVRKFVGREGESKVKLFFDPRPDYGLRNAQMRRENGKLMFEGDGYALLLHLPEGVSVSEDGSAQAIEFTLTGGECKQFIIEYAEDAALHSVVKLDYEKETEKFWREWVAKGNYFDYKRAELVRSAITLKLMQFYPTGAIIAAPTTSLPECIGGERNWDYRYAWVRDATFTLYALNVLGYKEEAERFFGFIERTAKECEDCNIELTLLYSIDGKPVPHEEELGHLKGFENSKPVRIGNGARHQFQLDIYGSLIDAHYFMTKHGIKLSNTGREIVLELVEKIKREWNTKDNGIWEVRTPKQHFTYSKVMAWVGINRALRICDQLDSSAEKKKEMEALEKEIEGWIWENCYDEKTQIFKQYPETSNQDATNLLFVPIFFLNRHEERTRSIIDQTCRELTYEDIFVYRYRMDDGLKGDEGAFVLCTFWLISALAMVGELNRAKKIFSKFEKYIADHGLISEEIEPKTGEYLGNYPQAFSHIGYIMSAYYINKYSERQKVD
jgi:GH15 family glucan-1,4-alpha-glucosidase